MILTLITAHTPTAIKQSHATFEQAPNQKTTGKNFQNFVFRLEDSTRDGSTAVYVELSQDTLNAESGPDVTATAGERHSRGCHLGTTTAKSVALAAAVDFLAGR